ncbi:MAG: FAD-dependent oxidoreductase [Spirochaeta sp.]|nr:FAD-dependent oxidoreductase [Spirochaeta sp.]
MYDVAVIGAGIIGTSVARELSRYSLRIALIEKDNDAANGTTKANSGIIHAGYDARPGSNKAKYNALGNPMFDKLCEELAVPFKRIGSLVIALENQDMENIEELYNRGLANGVPEMRILNGGEVRKMEPNLNEKIIGALHAPTAGIIDPWDLALALAENAVENGVELLLNHRVTAIDKLTDRFKIRTSASGIETRYVINCAGLYADQVNNMAAAPYFKITPRRGQYFVLDKNTGSLVNNVVFQCPGKMGKGVLLTSSIHGNLLIGPDSEVIDDKENLETTAARLLFVKESAAKTAFRIPFNTMIKTFAGLRATPSTGDFIVEESKDASGFINVAGIESPGLTAAPAIAEEVARLLKATAGELIKRDDFNPLRRKVIRFMELKDQEKSELVRKNPAYGRVVCRCENVTEGEVVDAISRKAGATTVNGIKRRVRPGMGRCQGGFCAPKVMELLARELGRDMQEIVKEGKESYILADMTKGEQHYKGKERGN